MAIYRVRPCLRCSKEFHPRSSREKHCSWQCRFLDIYSLINQDDRGCVNWPKSKQPSGYGQMGIGDCIPITTHRLSWIVHRGQIPSNLCVLHKCDNRACINPEHLFLGTDADNAHDMIAKGRKRCNPLRGADHPLVKDPSRAFRKLGADQVSRIIADTRPHRAIAADYGVCHTSVGRLKRKFAGSEKKTVAIADMAKSGK